MRTVAFSVLLLLACSQYSYQKTSTKRETGGGFSFIKFLIHSMLRKMESLITEMEQKTACQPIVGPKSLTDRIAIVGGGIAGLHMAYLLKKKGYTNVVILEKESRVGGKIMSVEYDGVMHEMGACYCTPDYSDNVYELAYELGMSENDFIPVPSSESEMFLDEVPGVPLTFEQFVVWDIMNNTRATTKEQAMFLLVRDTLKYIVTHVKYFGLYPGDLMPRPSEEMLEKLKTSYWSFLSEHNMKALHPLLVFSHALQGYGYLDEVSPIYGMMWNTPKLVFHSVKGALTRQFPIKIFRDGFSQIPIRLEPMLNIKKEVQISKIDRSENEIKIEYQHEGKTHSEEFDFLIWAVDGKEALKVLSNPTEQEKKFKKLISSWFATTLVDTIDECNSKITIKRWLSSLFRKDEYSVMAFRDSKGVLLGRECPSLRADISGVTYQYGGKTPLGSSIVDENFEQHFKDVGIEEKKIIKRQIWEYFNHYSVEDMSDGILWDILEKQGQKKTWFIGGSVSHESVKSIINYNKQLIRGLDC